MAAAAAVPAPVASMADMRLPPAAPKAPAKSSTEEELLILEVERIAASGGPAPWVPPPPPGPPPGGWGANVKQELVEDSDSSSEDSSSDEEEKVKTEILVKPEKEIKLEIEPDDDTDRRQAESEALLAAMAAAGGLVPKKEELKKENLKKENLKSEIKVPIKEEMPDMGSGQQVRDRLDEAKKKRRSVIDIDGDGVEVRKDRRKDRSRSRSRRRRRSRSRGGRKEGRKKRKTKWDDAPMAPQGFASLTAIPRGATIGSSSGFMSLPLREDINNPRFSAEELKLRTVVLENLPLSVTGQELIEFFNGAVLAVTGNTIQQANNKSMAPVFACTVTEEDRAGDKRKYAELKCRTPEGASVGIKLNGIEYKGQKVACKRPQDYDTPTTGDPAAKLNLHDMSMARLVGEAPIRREEEPSPKLSIFNVPVDIPEAVVRDLLSQFGKLRMMNLIKDLSTGKIKGYGFFEYEDRNDVELACQSLNGFVCGQNVIRVQKLGGVQPDQAPRAKPMAATAMANSMTQRIVSNPVLAMQVKQGREVGSRPSQVVQLLNAVYQEDLMDDQDYEDIMSEVHSEAAKHGTVQRVVIPKPAKDGSFIDGLGKIFVCFQDVTSARRFQMEANGRRFENRIVCAAFYPQMKFDEGKFTLWSK